MWVVTGAPPSLDGLSRPPLIGLSQERYHTRIRVRLRSILVCRHAKEMCYQRNELVAQGGGLLVHGFGGRESPWGVYIWRQSGDALK